jgi:transposase
MFIRSKPFTDNIKRRIQIVENIRVGNKVKQHIVRHVGVAHSDDEESKLRQYGSELMLKIQEERDDEVGQIRLFDSSAIKLGRPPKKDLRDILPVDKVNLADIEEIERIVEGVHDIGGNVYDTLGFNKLLDRKRDQEILRDITLSRMVSPDSKRGLQKILSEQFDKDHQLDSIYRMMDKLHLSIPKIKELCFIGTRSLIPNQEISMIFFDVTTLYFESTELDELRNFGYSKDHRFNTTQLVLALATNEEGLPIGYELFSGNTAEVKTLLVAIDSWKSYLNVKDVCFVADRAMFTRSNLQALDESGYSYVIAAKLKTLKQETKEVILNEESYNITVLGNQLAWVCDLEYEGKRLITSYKSSRAKNDAHERSMILQKIAKTLGSKGSTKKLVSNSGVKKYTSMQDSSAIIDDNKISQDELWDGLHGVITNDHKLTPQEILAKYARLWVIEESFRINKHNLQMRPIFHWSPRRIESHIAICYMSFAILRHIEYKVSLTQKISPKEIMGLLFGVQSSIYRHKKTKDLYRMPGVTKNDARKIYRTFNLQRSQNAEIYLK